MLDDKKDDDDEGSVAKPDWKKKKIGDDERLTLRIDALEAEKYQSKKNKTQTSQKKNAFKMSKKVRQAYDEEEDENEDIDEMAIRSLHELQINQNDASNGDMSLINALAPHEKQQIEQSTTLEIARNEQNAGRLNAIEQADKLARQAGLSKMSKSEHLQYMQNAIYNPSRIREQALEKNIKDKTGIKGEIRGKTEEKTAVKGIKKVKETTDNRKVRPLKLEDVKKLGKNNASQVQTAELILKKSGQTAKLQDLKRKHGQIQEQDMSKISPQQEKDNQKEQKQPEKKSDRTYAEQMKSLLKESLKHSNKVR